MGANSEMFLQMRAEDVATMYDATFTKKEAIMQGKSLVNQVVEEGLIDKTQFMANLVRLKAVIDTTESEMRNHLPIEKIKVMGVEFTPVDGGNNINFNEDEVFRILQKEVDERKELLKLAQKQETFDGSGNQVPKVSLIPRKSSITIKF